MLPVSADLLKLRGGRAKMSLLKSSGEAMVARIDRRSVLAGILVAFFSLLGGLAAPAQNAGSRKAPALIVFMTDFGIVDDAVPICKGVMLGIAPEARILDITHQVTPFSIADGARFLYGTTPYYPA
jgi:S-adenosyl-L-methionine hydrolase (adenosine-forming)